MKLRRTSIAIIFAACATLATTAWAGNGQNLLQYVPQNSYLVFNIDVAQVWNTPLFQMIWGMTTADPEVQGNLTELQTQTGFNPATDIQTAMVVLSPTAENHFVMLVEGNFNPAQIGAFIASKAGEDVATTEYQGYQLYYDPSEPEVDRPQFAFPNNNLFVIGTHGMSNAVLDIMAGAGTNVLANVELNTVLATADMSGMLWFAGLTTPEMQAEMVGSPMAGVRSMRGNMSLTGGLTVNAVVNTSVDTEATAMADFLNMSIGQARANPDLAQMGMTGVLDSINITAAGPAVNINVAVPEQTVNQMIGIITAIITAQQMAGQEMMEPAPTEPAPTEPAPAEPAPAQTAPAEPTPAEPTVAPPQ